MMARPRCMSLIAILMLVGLGSSSLALAQVVDLAGLWPHEDGRTWTYTATWEDNWVGVESGPARLWFDGSGPGAGGVTVQYLWGEYAGGPPPPMAGELHGGTVPRGGFLGVLWRTRPDLRPRLEAHLVGKRPGPNWPFVLLGPSSPNEVVGFRATAQRVGVWRDAIADFAWLYLTDDLAVGAQFTLQLVPDLVDGVYLHAEVQSILPSMSLPAGDFDDVVVMSYLVDYGEQYYTNGSGDVFGPFRVETTGTVAFAMGEGPIYVQEETQADISDCPTCPPGILSEYQSRGELTLATRSVPAKISSFGGLKATYER